MGAIVVGKLLNCALDLIEGFVKGNNFVGKILDIALIFWTAAGSARGEPDMLESEESYGESKQLEVDSLTSCT